MEKNLDYQVVLGLKKDLNILQSKMAKALESDNVGTYINLQKALVNSLNAIKELSNEYKLMYSEYTTGEEKQRQVAVWEQNSNGDIKNHKVWNVEDISKRGLNAHEVTFSKYNESDIDKCISYMKSAYSVVFILTSKEYLKQIANVSQMLYKNIPIISNENVTNGINVVGYSTSK